jgi:hypothetical protein
MPQERSIKLTGKKLVFAGTRAGNSIRMIDQYTILSKTILQKQARKITSAEKKRNIVKCQDEDKIRTIVDHYNNHYLQKFHLNLLTSETTNKEMCQWKTIWRGLEGREFFNNRVRWCRKTLEAMYREALEANNRLGNKRTEIDSEVEVKMLDNLDSIIKDCDCYLLKNVHVRLVIKEKKKRGRNKSVLILM